MQKIILVPCHHLCKNPDFMKAHKILLLQAEIQDKDKQYYSYCKWCEVFYYSKNAKLNCKCCGKPACRVYKRGWKGRYYEY